METRTLFSDETKYYRDPPEPDPFETVHISFRTGRFQAMEVMILTEEEQIPMHWEKDHRNFDFYGADLKLTDKTVTYCFKAKLVDCVVYYGKTGPKFFREEAVSFVLIPGFHTPDWSKGCLYYQILPDRFFSGNPANNDAAYNYRYAGGKVLLSEWDDPIDQKTYRQFYGGDLKGILQKLPFLSELGVEALYLNPVFASPSSHKYDCCDYEHVDYAFGIAGDPEATDNCLAELIEAAHSCGIRVVLDGVFNHCSCYHRWFDKSGRYPQGDGAYGNPNSRYHNRFCFTDAQCTQYEAWWDIKTLPKLNYEGDESLCGDICGIAEKWLSAPYYADGWRLDVGADLGHSEDANHAFWREFRKAVKSTNPDALIMAEHYTDPQTWLEGTQWDSIMNYNAFMDPVSYFFTGIEKHSDICHEEMKGNAEVFAETLIWHSALMPGISLLSSLNQLDNHDHSRFLTRTNGAVGRLETLGSDAARNGIKKHVLRQAAGFMYFWPGSPGLYYGDEAGVCGFTDPDNRRVYPWESPDTELIDYFRFLGKLRKKLTDFRDASCRILYAENSVFAYARFTDEKTLIVIVSASDEKVFADIPVWIAGLPGYEENRILHSLLYSAPDTCSSAERPYMAHNGILAAEVEGGSLTILTS